MARVLVAKQSWGVQFRTVGDNVLAWQNLACSIDTTVYASDVGSTPVSSFTTNPDGELPGWVEEGTYNLTVNGVTTEVATTTDGRTLTLETSSAALLARDLAGTGSPESAVTANPGSTFAQTDAAEGSAHWIKETGTGNTGWRKARRLIPHHIDLYGPECRAAEALQGDAAMTTYDWPGAALSSSTWSFQPGISGRVLYATWTSMWTPNATGCGIRLVQFDDGPTNIVQLAAHTGSALTTPTVTTTVVTTEVQAIQAFVGGGAIGDLAFRKHIGHQLKGNGAVGPLIYVSRLYVLYEA